MDTLMDETIASDSNVGSRLGRIKKSEATYLYHGRKKTPVTGALVIGRDRSCGIVIDDRMVSRKHALIQKIRDAYFVKDLDSKNGVKLNGTPIPRDKYVRIHSTDVITVGRTDLTFKTA
ncbi:MAG: FHA domain-containing protein [Spirochaetota bacterium]